MNDSPPPEIRRVLDAAPAARRDGMEFLVTHMPDSDRASLSAKHRLEHVDYAARVRHETPVGVSVPEDVFREWVLPYAHLDERRDRWRPLLHDRFVEIA